MKAAALLVPNWRRVLRRAWSVRFNVLTAVLCAAEVGMQIWAPSHGGWAAGAAALTSLAANLARIVLQTSVHEAGK